jgi:AraC-like DNA-binding protein
MHTHLYFSDTNAASFLAAATSDYMRMHQHDTSEARARHRPGRALGLRTVHRGAEAIAWPQRSVRLDADVYVVVDPALAESWPLEAGTQPLVVELAIPDDAAIADFTPTLRSIDDNVGRRLAEMARQSPGSSRIWLAGEVSALVWADLMSEEKRLRARAERIACVKPSTREALFRRLLLSADFIQSNYAEPLHVDVLAEVSNLSPFHFARLFGLVMDTTPHAFLSRKRVAVARRLLAGGMTRGEAAVRAGFGCRTTLFRHLQEESAARPS